MSDSSTTVIVEQFTDGEFREFGRVKSPHERTAAWIDRFTQDLAQLGEVNHWSKDGGFFIRAEFGSVRFTVKEQEDEA